MGGATDISHFKKLEGVCLGFNHLSSFPISIFKHQHLRQLYLNNNYLTAVPEELSRLHALEALNVGQNDLTKLPNSVTTLIKLQVLVVHGNPKLAGTPKRLMCIFFHQRHEHLQV
jgi:leucine-rich repeat protein SHOC2